MERKISYVYRGFMTHKDGIGEREVQWMTAEFGSMHQKNFPAAERIFGVQHWLNLPKKNKVAKYAYLVCGFAYIE